MQANLLAGRGRVRGVSVTGELNLNPHQNYYLTPSLGPNGKK